MGLLDSILGSALGGSEGQGGARDPKVALLIGLVTMLMSRQGGAAQGGGDGGGLLGSLGSNWRTPPESARARRPNT